MIITYSNSINDNNDDNEKKLLASVLAEASLARAQLHDNDRASAIYSALSKIDDANKHDNNNNEENNEHTKNNNTSNDNLNVFQRRELPDNATVWELFKEQIRSDFAPVIMLLPQPVKTFIKDQYDIMKDPCKKIILGAAQPMLKAASALFHNVGNLMIIVGKECNKLAASISEERNDIKKLAEANQRTTTTTTTTAKTRIQEKDTYIYEEDEDELGDIIIEL